MYKKGTQGWLKHLDFLLMDAICLEVSLLCAYILRHGWSNPFENAIYVNMMFVLVFIQVIVVFFFETFKNVLKRGYVVELRMTLWHDLLIIILFSFYLFMTQQGAIYSRLTLIYTGIIYLFVGYAVRITWKQYLKSYSYGKKNKRSLIIVTGKQRVDKVIQNIEENNYENFHLSGLVVMDCDMTGQVFLGIPVVAGKADACEYVCREWVDEVFIDIPDTMPFVSELIDSLLKMGVTVHIKLAKAAKLVGQKRVVERMGNYTVLTTSINMATGKELFWKRVMDICGGGMGCLITAILFVFVAPIIYIKSPGPIFFSQIRMGKNGRRFKIYKFRSMYMDAEERKKELMEQNQIKDGLMFKMEHDPRIIKGIGPIIRNYSIDEFPQFWNVLKGEMSIVGTRPPTEDEWEKYELHHRKRLAIKPGVTGMWQVSGRSSITDFEDVVKLDAEYIQKWSMGMDLRIILKTVLVVVGRDGAR